MPQLTQTSVWPDILEHANRVKPFHLRHHFAEQPGRFEHMSLSVGELFLDYSKQCLLPETMELLATCLEQQDFAQRRRALFAGEPVNASEGRPALHMALRSSDLQDPFHDAIERERDRALAFAEALRAGAVKGATGRVIKNILHIGIGGSDLGPQLVAAALGDEQSPNLVFIRNVDSAPLAQAMARLDPEETLLFIASKTFTTAETMLNANTLLAWLGKAMDRELALQHVVALTASPEKAKAYGVQDSRVFCFWDWVGGRFSIWSSIGLPAMAALGRLKFTEFLRGAEAMDAHFVDAPLSRNMPALLAMLSVWNINVLGATSRAVLPYCEALREWPGYLQQLEMESLGKSVDQDGKDVLYATSPVVFGMTGTPAQHAFMQALHQGTQIIPVEIIMVNHHEHGLPEHHDMLNANGLAQAEALLRGKTADELKQETACGGAFVNQKTFSGNRPSSVIIMDALSPFAMGQLVALYEHKVFTESVFWNLNPFDQWGVELGKTLAAPIQNALGRGAQECDRPWTSSSTIGLIKRLRNL